MNDIITGVFISDIHFGALDETELYNQLVDQFINKIYKLPKLDLIVIGGDLFHDYRLALDSSTSKKTMKFINRDIVNLCKHFGCGCRIIKGTKSHDGDQLDNFRYIEEYDDIDFKIISNKYVENFRGFDILYLPEEYMKDSDEYYKDEFNNSYDFIMGHGMFKEVAFDQKSEINLKRAPIFDSKKLCSICDGPILFGHIHTRTTIRNQIYYPGSFSRWVMGEEKKKSFNIFIYNKTSKKYLVTPVYNKMALNYTTMDLNPYLQLKPDVLIKTINDTILSYDIQKLRLKANQTENNVSTLFLLQDYYKNNKTIDLVIKNNMKLVSDEEQEKEDIEKYGYIYDKSIEIEERISLFLRYELDEDVTEDEVYDILNKEVEF